MRILLYSFVSSLFSFLRVGPLNSIRLVKWVQPKDKHFKCLSMLSLSVLRQRFVLDIYPVVTLKSFMLFLVLLQPWSPFCFFIPDFSVLDFVILSVNTDAAQDCPPHFILMCLLKGTSTETQQYHLSETQGTLCSLFLFNSLFFKGRAPVLDASPQTGYFPRNVIPSIAKRIPQTAYLAKPEAAISS